MRLIDDFPPRKNEFRMHISITKHIFIFKKLQNKKTK